MYKPRLTRTIEHQGQPETKNNSNGPQYISLFLVEYIGVVCHEGLRGGFTVAYG